MIDRKAVARVAARYWAWAAVAVALLFPLLPDSWSARAGGQFKDIFIFCILALGLNVVVGYSGLLQLGIAAFFGIGAYITGILTVQQYPFQIGFWPAMILATFGAGLAGVLLAAPTLRLRGDYLAIVTLGFGEVVMFSIKYLESITAGAKALNPLPPPWLLGLSPDWSADYRWYYYLCLALLAVVVALLYNLENSRLGRAWMAIREDELAATCMGINAVRVKLSAFAVGAALAGLAGALYATSLNTTGGPDSYTFNRSITVLCFLIIGGMGNIKGALLGTFVLMGYDNILTPALDEIIQKSGSAFRFTSIKLVVFGLALILMMRFRPEGILPSRRVQLELHEPRQDPEVTRVGVE
jgi:branched-chain amino acid transport system permease protein